jgi:ribose transport system permease protein
VLLALLAPNFLTIMNLSNLLRQIAVLGIVAVGLTFAIIPGELDVSMGSVVVISGVFSVSMMTMGYGVYTAIIVALMVGAVIGLLNGILAVYGHISSLIVTLTMALIVDGVSLLYTGGKRLYRGILPSYTFLGRGEIFGVPMPVVLLFLVIIIAYLLAHRTVFGRRLYAVGGNVKAARLVGIKPNLLLILSFILCSVSAALAGIIVTARSGTAEPFGGFGYTLDAFAVVFIGTTIGKEGEPTIPGTLLGIIILGILSNGLTLVGAPFFAQNIIKGVLVLIMVVVSSLLRNQNK